MDWGSIVEKIKQHWPMIAGIGAIVTSTGCVAFMVAWFKLRFWGSRRGSRNWKRPLEVSGDITLLKPGLKRVNPDTINSEGDAATIYYQVYTAYFYEVVNGVRYCYLRSYVIEVYAYYQWETFSRLGQNLMTQFCSDTPLACTGLEEKKDEKGESYWVKVPVADVYVDQMALADLAKTSVSDPRPVQVQD